MIETKDKILDSAERLFSEAGYAATSLRHIIAGAQVNLAAIHYHFGSKEGLLDQLILRRVDPVNRQRIAMLDRFEAEAGGAPVELEKVLEAFLAPATEMAKHHPEMSRLMGRLHAEGQVTAVFQRHFETTKRRFIEALRRALPHLDEREFLWRLHFVIGSMAHTLCSPPFAAESARDSWQVRTALLVAFLSAGLRAPAAAMKEVEVAK